MIFGVDTGASINTSGLLIALIGVVPASIALYKSWRSSQRTQTIKEVLDSSSSVKSLDQVIKTLQDQVEFQGKQISKLQIDIEGRDVIIDGLRAQLKKKE